MSKERRQATLGETNPFQYCSQKVTGVEDAGVGKVNDKLCWAVVVSVITL